MASCKVFINYRREDAGGYARSLKDRLNIRFPGSVFMDVSDLEPGMEWDKAIEQVLGECDAMVVVIGRNWLTLTGVDGQRRLDDPRDFVRLEIAKALKHNTRVFPVLVGGANMPPSEELPPEIEPLVRRHALQLTDQDWDFNVDRLIQSLERSTVTPTPERSTASKSSSSAGIVRSLARRRLTVALFGILAVASLTFLALKAWRLTHRPNVAGSSSTKSPERRIPKPDQLPAQIESSRTAVTLELVDSFIERYKNRATLIADLQVTAVGRIHSPATDGDLHFAGTAEQVLLPVVAELMNAASHREALPLLRSALETRSTVAVSGAWRLWPESGTSEQSQGITATASERTSNPEHVFELHPVTRISDLDLGGTLVAIAGFTPKSAQAAIAAFERVKCKIVRDAAAQTTKIETPRVGFNYVAFVMKVTSAPERLVDGHALVADVLDESGNVLSRARRMIFVGGTPPEMRARGASTGAKFHVVGVPRISLKDVAAIHSNDTIPLPYEFVIVVISD